VRMEMVEARSRVTASYLRQVFSSLSQPAGCPDYQLLRATKLYANKAALFMAASLLGHGKLR
jgi:hypothetical protein